MLSNLRLALRQLRKSPGFAITAIITLALGIGANAVVFSVLNALILKPLNVPEPERVFSIQRSFSRMQTPSQSYPDYLDIRDRNRTFDSIIACMIIGPVGVNTGARPSTAWPYLISGNYFDSLQVQPYLGRFFHASDEKGMNSAPYVVLSYAYWRGYFHGDTNILGQALQINKHPFTIIGVAPPAFRGTELFFAPAMWIPIVEQPTVMGSDNLKNRGNHSPFLIGRLKPGVTTAQATEDLNAIAAVLAKTYPSDDDDLKFSLARPGLFGDTLGGPAKAFMAGLMLLAGLILLAACANLGSLFAARAADRGKEIALRLALGSKRKMILNQLLTEAMLVSLAGGAIGLALGVVILRGLSAWQPIPDIPINVPVNPDLRTYVVALLLALISGLLFGIMPVRQVMRADPWQMIRTGISGTSSMKRFNLRDILLVIQIAICAVLVTSSLVAVRGLTRSLHSNFGFQPENVILADSDLQMAAYPETQEQEMQRRMIDAVGAIPGVTAVGFISNLPLSLGGGDSYVYSDTTTDYRPSNYAADAMNYNISPGYLDAAGTKLLAGRNLTLNDNDKAPKVALVNRRFAVKVFGSVDKAVGGHFKFWGGNRAEVVGVVEDGKYRTLTEDPMAAMFFSFLQQKTPRALLVIRTPRDPQDMIQPLQRTIHGLDSALPIRIQTWTSEMNAALFAARVASIALGVLGLLGAMLAVTGIFGMASYSVSKRLRELGIRVALGAGKGQVLRTAIGRAFYLMLIGSVVGLGLGVLATRVLAFIVYQATPKDPLVMIGVCLTMLALGLVAAWIPARRAMAVDPLILLRDE
jgi:predicted permease